MRALHEQELVFLQENLGEAVFATESEDLVAVLKALGTSAYRSIRPDLASMETPSPLLLDLLSLAESRKGQYGWQQIALLGGFQVLARTDGFVPAQLEAAPPIFADGSISEKDPLWNARLASRVAFTWPGDELALGIKPLSPEQIALMDVGLSLIHI